MQNIKINYQLETDRIINELQSEKRRPKLLLHACCAPCASYVLKYLTKYFDVTVFFSNSNITDKDEYDKRLLQLYKLVENASFAADVKIAEDVYEPDSFFEAAKGLEAEKEGGARCNKCFLLRMESSAKYARDNGFEYFATTLTVSPHKNASLINNIGCEMQKKHSVKYLLSDFKKRDGYKRSIELSKEYDLYRQEYCGCCFSIN